MISNKSMQTLEIIALAALAYAAAELLTNFLP